MYSSWVIRLKILIIGMRRHKLLAQMCLSLFSFTITHSSWAIEYRMAQGGFPCWADEQQVNCASVPTTVEWIWISFSETTKAQMRGALAMGNFWVSLSALSCGENPHPHTQSFQSAMCNMPDGYFIGRDPSTDPTMIRQIELARIDLQIIEQEIQTQLDEADRHRRRANEPHPEEPFHHERARVLDQEIEALDHLLNELNQELDAIHFEDFESVQLEQMARLVQEDPTIRDSFTQLSTGIEQVKASIRTEIQNIDRETRETATALERTFERSSPRTEEFFNAQTETQAFPPFGDTSEHLSRLLPGVFTAKQTHPISQIGEQVISQLDKALREGNSTRFNAVLKSWTLFQTNANVQAQSNPSTSALSLNQLRRTQKHVLGFVHQHVDLYGFFSSLQISGSLKRFIATDLKDWDETLSRDLREELNTWQGNLNSNQEEIIRQIQSLEPLIHKLQDPRLQNPSEDSDREAARQLAKIVTQEALLLLIQSAQEANQAEASPLFAERRASNSETHCHPMTGDDPPENPKNLTQVETNLIQSKALIQLGLGLSDFALGLSPVGPAKDLIEAITGISLLAQPGARLEMGERVLLAITGVMGVYTFGGSHAVIQGTKAAIVGIKKALKKAPIPRAYKTKVLQKAAETLDSAGGKVLQAIRKTGTVAADDSYKIFDKASKIGNPIPEGEVFARIVPKNLASKIKSGELSLSRPNFHNEAFVTAYDDVRAISDPKDLANKLSLFMDQAGTIPVDTSNYVVLKFKFKGDTALLASPVEFGSQRGFGFLPGGKTVGGAREWIIDSNINQRNLIEFID